MSDNKERVTIDPSYKEALEKAGGAIKNRFNEFVPRMTAVLGPIVIAFVIFSIINEGDLLNPQFAAGKTPWYVPLAVAFVVWFCLSTIYYFLIRSIFDVEKRVWITSYFDGQNLSSSGSWKKVSEMLVPLFGLGARLFAVYYLVPLVIYSAFAIGFFYFVFFGLGIDRSSPLYSSFVFIFPIVVGVLTFGIIYYFAYLGIKLQFAWFLFLDLYQNKEFSYSTYFKKLALLTSLTGGSQFTESLKGNFGTSSVAVIAREVTGTLNIGFDEISKVGNLMGSLLTVASGKASGQVASLGKVATVYIIYLFVARSLHSGGK